MGDRRSWGFLERAESGVLFGEHFGTPERLSAVGEDGGPAVLVFDGPLLACVLKGEDVVAVGTIHISFPASPSYMLASLGSWTPDTDVRRIRPLRCAAV
jgi:hypothetical protein